MRLSRGHLRWVYASGLALFASGALWLLFHYFVQVQGELGERPHALEVWWLRLHGAAAMLMLAVLGSLLPVHIRRGWHQRKNLVAGSAVAGFALLLIISGYALYYFGSEETRPWISAFHWLLGLGTPALLIWHIVSGRRTRTVARVSSPAAEPMPYARTGSSEQASPDHPHSPKLTTR